MRRAFGFDVLACPRYGVQPELGDFPLPFCTQAFNELPVAAARRINGSATVCAAFTVVP